MTERKFPDDVHPESGCRLPPVDPGTLPPAAREVYEAHLDPNMPTLAGLWGPGGVKLHSPKLSEYSRDYTRYLRFEAGIDPAIREVAILVAAREADSQFEWVAHEPEALRQGVDAAVIDAIKHRKPVAGMGEKESAVIVLGRQMLGDHKVTPETYAEALRLFGPRMLLDIVALMGNYTSTAALLCAVDMQLPPGKEPLLPIP